MESMECRELWKLLADKRIVCQNLRDLGVGCVPPPMKNCNGINFLTFRKYSTIDWIWLFLFITYGHVRNRDRRRLISAAQWQPATLMDSEFPWEFERGLVGGQEYKLFNESETIMLALRIFQHWLIFYFELEHKLVCSFHPSTLALHFFRIWNLTDFYGTYCSIWYSKNILITGL